MTCRKIKRKFIKILKNFLFNLPYIKEYITKVPPGHYYSPIPSKSDIMKREKQIYDGIYEKPILDIELNVNEQLKLLNNFKIYYKNASLKNKENREKYQRYYTENNMFDYTDAYFLHSMIRYFKPKKYYEIGSGFSSAVVLDANDEYFEGSIECRFIEPYPDRLYSLLTEDDKNNNKIKIDVNSIQDINSDLFMKLKKNDFLFIDSSHTVKLGSDVNYIIFEIFPKLKSGVIIHIHDIQYPFEYYREFFIRDEGLLNEIYFVRAFLMNNQNYKILLWPEYLIHNKKEWFIRNMPKILKQGTGSIWLKKV